MWNWILVKLGLRKKKLKYTRTNVKRSNYNYRNGRFYDLEGFMIIDDLLTEILFAMHSEEPWEDEYDSFDTDIVMPTIDEEIDEALSEIDEELDVIVDEVLAEEGFEAKPAVDEDIVAAVLASEAEPTYTSTSREEYLAPEPTYTSPAPEPTYSAPEPDRSSYSSGSSDSGGSSYSSSDSGGSSGGSDD